MPDTWSIVPSSVGVRRADCHKPHTGARSKTLTSVYSSLNTEMTVAASSVGAARESIPVSPPPSGPSSSASATNAIGPPILSCNSQTILTDSGSSSETTAMVVKPEDGVSADTVTPSSTPRYGPSLPELSPA